MQQEISISSFVSHLFRQESGKMVAALTRLLGFNHLETAEDIAQDTLLKAMSTWSYKGIPENPSGWLYTVAKNKAIDFLRKEKLVKKTDPLLQSGYSLVYSVDQVFLENEIEDSQLRMMFACCHPAVPEDAQVAFILKTLCGLSTKEIANAYLSNEETIAKRVYRAKEKIRAENISLHVPQGEELISRLDTALRTIYLLFNEGYNSSHPDLLIREDLCYEAIRLCHLLSHHKLTGLPKTNALLSLMCLQASRLPARLDDKGNIILLREQDRSKWNRELIKLGLYYIALATEKSEVSEITSYHLEAGIASLHAAASSFETTDWKSLYHLYETLYLLSPSPVIALNKAIASAYAINKKNALEEMMKIKGLENYYLWYASAGEMYFEMGQKDTARQYFEKAHHLTTSPSEQQLLLNKIRLCN